MHSQGRTVEDGHFIRFEPALESSRSETQAAEMELYRSSSAPTLEKGRHMPNNPVHKQPAPKKQKKKRRTEGVARTVAPRSQNKEKDHRNPFCSIQNRDLLFEVGGGKMIQSGTGEGERRGEGVRIWMAGWTLRGFGCGWGRTAAGEGRGEGHRHTFAWLCQC